jgi:hypothetical protein
LNAVPAAGTESLSGFSGAEEQAQMGGTYNFADVAAAGTESLSGFSGAEEQARLDSGAQYFDAAAAGTETLSGFSGAEEQAQMDADASLQADFAGINEDIGNQESLANVGEAPGFFGDGKLASQMGMDLVSAAIQGIIPNESPNQPQATSGGGISDGLLASLLGIGSGKKDPLSDLQTRGIGV